MLAKDVVLNIVPFGHRGMDKKPKKGEKNPLDSWREYQNMLCPRKVNKMQNAALICGKVPGKDYQIIVLDFDGQFGSTIYKEIVMVLEEHNLERFFMVSWTANRGFHFVYLVDTEVLINNKQKRTLKEGMFPRQVKKIDIRGNGGLIYFPPTKFSDSAQEYKIIYQYPLKDIAQIISSSKLNDFINSLYVEKKAWVPREMTQDQVNLDVKSLVNDRLKLLREPLRSLVQPRAIDIMKWVDASGMDELLYWTALWREVLSAGISEDFIMHLLDRYQPEFNHEETIKQLSYMDMSFRPFTNKTLEKMFPGWKASDKKTFKKGFV